MRKGRSRPLTPDQKADLDVLAALPEEGIDTHDIPEVRNWSGARRGVFYRPVTRQITLQIDDDVIQWFKSQTGAGERYQAKIIQALREYVERHRREPGGG